MFEEEEVLGVSSGRSDPTGVWSLESGAELNSGGGGVEEWSLRRRNQYPRQSDLIDCH